MKYVVTAFSMWTKPHSYVCKDRKEAETARDELRAQQYKVEIEEVNEEDLTEKERAELV